MSTCTGRLREPTIVRARFSFARLDGCHVSDRLPPQESLRVFGEYVDTTNARWIFPQMKSKGKKSPRIIYLNDDAMDISNRLLGESPTGELFRNSAGRAWTTETVNCAIDHVQIRMGKKILAGKNVEPREKEIAKRI